MKPGNFEKLISKDRLKEKVEDWKFAKQTQEGENLRYKFNRLDSERVGFLGVDFSIRGLHGVSFIKDVIPKLIAGKKKGEKVRILDVGAGSASFADQIRKAFPDNVIVFSTGLDKETAMNFRRNYKSRSEHDLHPNDLKWHSILELSDFPEFDLIIDTYGEHEYSAQQAGFNTKLAMETITEYLIAIIKKLKPGGLASISPVRGLVFGDEFSNLLKSFEEKYNVKILIPKNYEGPLRIEKNKPK